MNSWWRKGGEEVDLDLQPTSWRCPVSHYGEGDVLVASARGRWTATTPGGYHSARNLFEGKRRSAHASKAAPPMGRAVATQPPVADRHSVFKPNKARGWMANAFLLELVASVPSVSMRFACASHALRAPVGPRGVE